jgi:hypothetical protein
VCLGIAIGLGIKGQVEPVRGWPQAAGWVAGFRTYQGGDQGPFYRAVVAFRAHNQVVTFDASTTTEEPPVVGSRALVSYDPANPADAHDLSMGSAWGFPFYAGIVFLVVALLAVFFWPACCCEPDGEEAAFLSPGLHVAAAESIFVVQQPDLRTT